jgi:hypothetical protein
MHRLIPLAIGALAVAVFALAQHTVQLTAGESPVGQTETVMPMPVPAMTPIPTLTPLPIATPMPMGTTMPMGSTVPSGAQ